LRIFRPEYLRKQRGRERKLLAALPDRDSGESEPEVADPEASNGTSSTGNRVSAPSTWDSEHKSQNHQVQNERSSSHEEPKRSGGGGRKGPHKDSPSLWRWFTSLKNPSQIIRALLQLTLLATVSRAMGFGIGIRQGPPPPRVVQVVYSDFLRAVEKDEVANVNVDALQIKWEAHPRLQPDDAAQATDSAPEAVSFVTNRPPDTATPYEQLVRHNVKFGAADRAAGNRVITVLLTLLYVSILVGFLQRMNLPFMQNLSRQGAGRSVRGRSGKAIETPDVRFADVAGVDEAKGELTEIVDILRDPERYTKLGARPPTGVLLVGAPGVGKTLLAKAVAGEADVPFITVSASEFVELYVGMGAARVREMFARARQQAPCIVFIDEIDAVAKGRGDGRLRGTGNDEREQTLNQLLTELDGFETGKLVICLAATNRPDTLDAALRRPGRFDRIVSVESPDRQGRMEILQVHINNRGLPLAGDVTLEGISAATVGFTGAELANLVNEAALLAGRARRMDVGQENFDDAMMRLVAGIEKKRSLLTQSERVVVAKHEVGHAVVGTAVASLVQGCPRVEQLSIVSRTGGALGFTYFPAQEERTLMFTDELMGRLATLLAGRAAEEIVCGRVSSGASDDIQRATQLAYQAVSEFGLSEAVGPLSLQALSGGEDYLGLGREGGDVGEVAKEEAKVLLNGALMVAKDVVQANREVFDVLAEALLELEHLEGDRLYTLLSKVKAPVSLEQFVNRMYIKGAMDQ